MRPKAPFLQNLRKKHPEPKTTRVERSTPISQSPTVDRASRTPNRTADRIRPSTEYQSLVPPELDMAFKPLHFSASLDGNFALAGISPAVTEPESESVEPIDVDRIRAEAQELGYARAQSEIEVHRKRAEELELHFNELAQSMEESRLQWIHEVRGGVVDSLNAALYKALGNSDIQKMMLQQRLAEAVSTLAEEKSMKVFVSAGQVEFARSFLGERSHWEVLASDEVDGGAILESANGIWDARISVTIDEFDQLLREWLEDQQR